MLRHIHPPPRRRAALAAAFGLALAGAGASGASAEAADPAQLRRDVYSNVFAHEVEDTYSAADHRLAAQMLARVYARFPEAHAGQAATAIRGTILRPGNVTAAAGEYDLGDSLAAARNNIAKNVPFPAGSRDRALWQNRLGIALREAESALRARREASWSPYDTQVRIASFDEDSAAEAAAAAWDCARRNVRCASAFDATFKPVVGVSVAANAKALNTTPVMSSSAVPVRLNETTGQLELKAAPGRPVTAAQVEAALQAKMDAVTKALEQATAAAKQLDTAIGGKQVVGASLTKEQEKALKDAAAERDKLLKDARKVVPVLLDVLKTTGMDAQSVKQVEIAAGTVLDLATAVNDFVGTAVSAASSGNPVGMVIGFCELGWKMFEGLNTLTELWATGTATSKPKPRPIVEQQIEKLSAQVEALQKNMTNRFDRVDRALNQIYSTLVTGFQELHLRLDKWMNGIDTKIDDLRDDMYQQSLRIDRFERNMRQLSRDATDTALANKINAGIGSRARTGQLMTRLELDRDFLSPFYTHADVTARSTIALGATTRPGEWRDLPSELPQAPFLASDVTVPNRLTGQLEENVNYIAGVAATRLGLTPLFDTALPNYRDWALAARGYARMLVEQPESAPLPAGGSNGRLDALERTGTALQRNLGKLAAHPTLFTRALEEHGKRSEALVTALRGVEKAFLDKLGITGEILYGGPSRPIEMATPAAVKQCGLSAGLSTPANVTADAFVPPELRVAAAVGLGGAELCWEASWTDVRGGPTRYSPSYGTVVLQLRSVYEGRTVVSRTLRMPDQLYCTWTNVAESPGRPQWEQSCVDAAWHVLQRWERGLKAGFAAEAVLASDGAYVDAIREKVRKRLDELQAALRLALRDAIRQRPDAPDTAARAALEVTGAKVLAQNLVGLGLPVAAMRDDWMPMLLAGDQSILDEEIAVTELQPVSLDPPEKDPGGPSPFVQHQRDMDPVKRIADRDAERRTQLGKAIAFWQQAVREGRHHEYHEVIEATMDQLALARQAAYPMLFAAPPSSVVIGDVRVTEGSGVNPVATVTLTRDGDVSRAASVSWVTANLEARAPADYRAATGVARFAAGTTTTAVRVAVIGDRVDEADERFVVRLSAPVQTLVGDGQAIVTITDDDPR